MSIVVPVFNEEEVLPSFLEEFALLLDGLAARDISIEVIFNDNGSSDRSVQILRGFRHTGSSITWNEFARNYGFQESILYGLKCATGDCVVVLQSDLQDPPNLVLDMVSQWQAGYLTVAGRPRTRDEGLGMRFLRGLYYSVTAAGSGSKDAKGILDFYLLDRVVAQEIQQTPYSGAFLRGRVAQTFGFQSVIEYDRAKRPGGQSKFGVSDLYEIGMSGLLLQSRRYIRLLALLGLSIALLSGLGLLLIGFLWLIGVRTSLSGWFSLTSFLLVILGVNSVGFALVFEYLSRLSGVLVGASAPQTKSSSQSSGDESS